MTSSLMGERIAKRIARAGLCSRRDAERWIAQGRVSINGQIVTSPATSVTHRMDIIVDGKSLGEVPSSRVWLYYKPVGLLNTHRDPQGRPTVFASLPSSLPWVTSVGRLDVNSEGLLLLTNDGEFARYAELPSTGWGRSYRVRVYGKVNESALKALDQGITVGEMTYGRIEAALERGGLRKKESKNTWLFMTLYEGKNREIRKVLEHLGLRVNRLIRVAYGPFSLGNLKAGEVKEVSVPKALGPVINRPKKEV